MRAQPAGSRPPWPPPPRPLPLWPVIFGPAIGVACSFVPLIRTHTSSSLPGALGFGWGMFAGLLIVLAILVGRGNFAPQTWIVAASAFAVLVWMLLTIWS